MLLESHYLGQMQEESSVMMVQHCWKLICHMCILYDGHKILVWIFRRVGCGVIVGHEPLIITIFCTVMAYVTIIALILVLYCHCNLDYYH